MLAIERHWCIRKPEASAIPTQHITIYPFFSLPNHTQFSFRCPPLSHAACVSQGKLIPPQVQSGALTGAANQHIPDLWLWHGFKWAYDPIQSEWVSGLLLGMLGQKCSFLDKVASGTESCFGTGYSKENQPGDKTNTEEGGVKRIAKNRWSFTSSVRGVSFFPIVVRSPPPHVGLLVALLPGTESFSHAIFTLVLKKKSAWTIYMSVGPVTPGAMWLAGPGCCVQSCSQE